jgi:tetratricopeptide (TPR) repeat protein
MTKKILCWIESAVFIVFILICGLTTYQRNFIWRDNLSLWSDVVKKSPAKARAYGYLGLAYHNAGDIDTAILQYKKSLSLNPFRADFHNNIGVSYFYKGSVDMAIIHFKHSIEIKPSDADAHYNLGIAYGEKGMYNLAYKEMRKGIELRKR